MSQHLPIVSHLIDVLQNEPVIASYSQLELAALFGCSIEMVQQAHAANESHFSHALRELEKLEELEELDELEGDFNLPIFS